MLTLILSADAVLGKQLTVAGEFGNGEFDAYHIARASGEVIVICSGSGRLP